MEFQVLRVGCQYIKTSTNRRKSIFFTGFHHDIVSVIMNDPAKYINNSKVNIPALKTFRSSLSLDIFSCKVFVGGLPNIISEKEISDFFQHFGPVMITWPNKEENKSCSSRKGYAFLLYQDCVSVEKLISFCVQTENKLYLKIQFRNKLSRIVQIRPWCITDSDFILTDGMPLDPRKTVFAGGVPRIITAAQLANIVNGVFGDVSYAGVDTDPEYKYPKGAGRITFSSQQSYVAAIKQRFIILDINDAQKRIEIKPYVLDYQLCDECSGSYCDEKYAQFFCSNIVCLKYLCEYCWFRVHGNNDLKYHKPTIKEDFDAKDQVTKYRRSYEPRSIIWNGTL